MSIRKNNNSDIAILLEDTPADSVLRLTLNDSKRRNALSEEMMTIISSALKKASNNKDVKVIIREFRQKLLALASEGSRNQVYQIAIQLYPLTNTSKPATQNV